MFQIVSQRKRRARSAARRSRKVVDLVDESGVSQDDGNGDDSNDVIVRIGVEEESSSAVDEGTYSRFQLYDKIYSLGAPSILL